MGFFKNLGHLAGGFGDIVKKAAPLASFIPGVGPAIAAGVGAGGALLGKLNDKHVTLGNTLGSMAGGAAIGGAGGYGIDKLQGAVAANGGGLSGMGKFLVGNVAHPGVPGVPGAPNPTDAVGAALGAGSAATGGFLGMLMKNPQLLATLAQTGGGLALGASEDKQAAANNALNTGALDLQRSNAAFQQDQARQQAARNAALDPIRMQAIQALLARRGIGTGAHA